MSSPLVIGIDSSTTSTKALVVDATGAVLAQGKAEFAMQTPRVDFYEQDPRDWWRSTDAAVGEAIAALSADDRSRITHLCATIQRQTFTLVDEAGEPIRPGILWQPLLSVFLWGLWFWAYVCCKWEIFRFPGIC